MDLKPQEHEQGSGCNMPPIQYIPAKDELQEAVDSTANTFKLILPVKVESWVPVWSRGTCEQFIIHPSGINVIEQWSLKEAYDKLVWVKMECTNKLEEAKFSLKIAQGSMEDSSKAKRVKMATKAYEKATKAVISVVNQIFLLYSNLLSKEAKQPWNKIHTEQVWWPRWMDAGNRTYSHLKTRCGTPFWSMSPSTYSQISDMMQQRHKDIIRVIS